MQAQQGVLNKNCEIWGKMYGEDTHIQKFPEENLVRLFFRNDPFIPKPPAKIFDHGFGCGNNALHFARLGYSVSGAEISKKSIVLVELRFNKENLPVGEFKLIEGFEMPFDDNSFDMVVSWNCTHYNGTVDNVKAVMRSLQRILKPGGVLLLSTITTNHALCYRANELGDGHFQVRDDFRHDDRGGINLFVPLSKEHFMEIYSPLFKNSRYGWSDSNLFVPDKTLSCHLLYGVKE